MNNSQLSLYYTETLKHQGKTVRKKMKEADKEEKSRKAEIIYYAHV
jgi:hypothetical protein